VLRREPSGEETVTVHFAHATGFNAETYSALLAVVDPAIGLYLMDARGHGRSRASADPRKLRSWRPYRKDLEAFASTLPQPLVLAGHSMGGFVVSANLYQRTTSDGISVPEGTIVVRVPAERLNETIEMIKGQSDREPLRESISSEDVTQDYVDLQSRLRNLEAAEEKLIAIMDEASKTEDVLSVYNELVRVQEEIEVIKGRINYYEQSARMSLISTELVADEAVQPLTIGGWEPVGVAKDAVQALINALKFLVNAGIWVLIFVLPVVLILFVVVYLPVRWIVRKTRGRKDKSGNQQPEEPACKEE